MSGISKVTAPKVPVTLSGKDYFFSPLTDRDLAEFDEWLRSRIIKTAMEAVRGEEDPVIKKMVIDRALEKADRTSCFTADGARVLDTLDGFVQIALMSLLKQHPDLTHETVRAMMTNVENIDSARIAFDRANANPTSRPAQKRKSRPKRKRKNRR